MQTDEKIHKVVIAYWASQNILCLTINIQPKTFLTASFFLNLKKILSNLMSVASLEENSPIN